MSPTAKSPAFTPARMFPWRWLIGVALVMGLGLRFWPIDQKVYWFDEVYSTFRAAGYWGAEIGEALFQDRPVAAPQLQTYQQLKPGSTAFDTLGSLAVEDPQHPPLYFLLARVWMQRFGSSVLASRALPVLISLVSLPLMYGLALELFGDSLTAWLATALLAISPVDILFAQTARQYSLLTLAVIGSGWLLLRAMRLNQLRPWGYCPWGYCPWGYYGLSVALGLYSHVFFLLNLVGHGVFVVWQTVCWPLVPAGGEGRSRQGLLRRFSLAAGLGLLLYGPWLMVLVEHRQRGLDTTSWASYRVEALTYLKFWLLSFTALVVDSNGSVDALGTYLPRLPVLVLGAWALWAVVKTAPRPQRAFILTAVLVPFLLLVGPDLILGGRRSTVTRYLLGAFPGVQLAMAYGLALLASRRRRLAQLVWAAILVGGLTSGLASARADTWWVKGVSATNGQVAAAINATSAPLVITDRGDHGLNQGNLLSLGYRLDPGVTLLPLSSPVPVARLNAETRGHRGALLAYYPSQALLEVLQNQGYRPVQTPVPGLWQLTQP